jgi:uncharacterized protein (DUF2252 family)
MRDCLAQIVDYNRQFRGRDPSWLRIKLDRLCASPFGFLRGTFHVFVADWPSFGADAAEIFGGTAQEIVGDLHLENLGAFKGRDGRFVFDVNDFDETGPGSPALDLGRMAVSLVLADLKSGLAGAVARIEAMLTAWSKAVQELDFRPITQETKAIPKCVRDVVARAEAQSRSEWLKTRVENGRFKRSDKYIPVEDVARRREVEDGVRQFAASVPEKPEECPAWPRALDVAVRIAGTGSLGRYRYAVLMPGKGEKAGKELILELKEAISSSLTPGNGDQAERVLATRRHLQADPPNFLGIATVAGAPYQVRELQPTEAKLDSATLGGRDFDELAAACGLVVGRLHRRGAAQNVPLQPLLRRITAFALRYAEVVEDDWARLKAQRADVEAQLLT